MLTEKWKAALKSGKATGFFIGAAALLILLVLLIPDQSTRDVPPDNPSYTAADYAASVEKKIAGMVTAITGESSPHVTVTLHSMGKTVYATEDRQSARSEQQYEGESINKTQTDDDTEKTYMILKSASGEQKPLIIMQTEPEIQGVVIVSAYGHNMQTKEQIILAVKTALDLSATQVCVTGSGEYT